jgi:tetratricopeptide (TPR) repeat protein
VTPRSPIFISAVSRELHTARQLVANTLTFLGYEPIWQDIFGTESGDLREVLRRQINRCKGVVQLVGKCYGAEPPEPDPVFGRVSYTQYEALYGRSIGKKVWYLIIDETFPVDRYDDEAEELRALQAAYRDRVKKDCHLFHPLTSTEGLEASVLKLRSDLVRLRRGFKQWAIAVAALLVLLIGLGFWLLHLQQRTTEQVGQANRAISEVTLEVTKLRQGILDYARIETQVSEASSNLDSAAVQERIYAQLARDLKLDPNLVRSKLRQVADDLRHAPNATDFERASAAYVEKDYVETERIALRAAAEASQGKDNRLEMQAFKLAGLAAHKRLQYAIAMEHLHDAEKLTDVKTNPADWCEVQHAIADVFLDQGHYREADAILRGVVDARMRILGPDHIDTLRSRNRLAFALWREGRYQEAVQAFEQIVAIETRILGLDDPETLLSRNGFAVALDDSGKHADAEKEHHDIFERRSRVLGPDHPDTLRSRNNLALAINRQGRYSEAESDFRELIRTEEQVLGPDHPETLRSRRNLIATLGNQGRDAEAETEFRDLIRREEKVLGADHPDTLVTRTNLAHALAKQGRYSEAEENFRDLIATEERVLGSEHPATLNCRIGLVGVLTSQGKHAEAEAQCREVIALQEKLLGPNHPNTLESDYHLAYDLAGQKRFNQAATIARRAADGAREILGKDHPLTQKYIRLLADLKVRD